MKITVDVEAPDEKKCSVINCDFHGNYNDCKLFSCDLERTENKILVTETYKCPVCLFACQKAEEQKTEMDQIVKAHIERNRYCASYGISFKSKRNVVYKQCAWDEKPCNIDCVFYKDCTE